MKKYNCSITNCHREGDAILLRTYEQSNINTSERFCSYHAEQIRNNESEKCELHII